jgi:recombination protein RecA
MPAAAQIRAEIEAALARRIPSALTPVPRIIRPTVTTGIDALDELLGGGLPVGAITEIAGPECSGRTSLALAFLGQITGQGKVCAWVDASDALHPESAAAAGVNLDRFLWVRCGMETAHSSVKAADSLEAVEAPQTARVQFGGNSPHPRTESKGMPSAIGDLLGAKAKYKRDRIIGTPGAPNRSLSAAQASREEQAASDRQPARRGSYVLEQREAYEPRCAEPQRKPRPRPTSYERTDVTVGRRASNNVSKNKPWFRLDQALRVTDLLLQAGGFSAIVLDMGSIAPEYVSRIPLATWFRYRAAAEQSQSSFVILSQHACAKSSAGVVLRLDNAEPQSAGPTIFSGLVNHAELVRRRYEHESENVVPIRKPSQRVNAVDWRSGTIWAMQREARRR